MTQTGAENGVKRNPKLGLTAPGMGHVVNKGRKNKVKKPIFL